MKDLVFRFTNLYVYMMPKKFGEYKTMYSETIRQVKRGHVFYSTFTKVFSFLK